MKRGEVNMRQDRVTGEYLAVVPSAYDQGRGRHYLALTATDGWVELSPEYVTRRTRTVSEYPEELKRAVDRLSGHTLRVVPRLLSQEVGQTTP